MTPYIAGASYPTGHLTHSPLDASKPIRDYAHYKVDVQSPAVATQHLLCIFSDDTWSAYGKSENNA